MHEYPEKRLPAQMQPRSYQLHSSNFNIRKRHRLNSKRQLRYVLRFSAASVCICFGAAAFALHPEESKRVFSAVTADFNYDETLGRLQFVRNILPESAMVFLESSDSGFSVYPPSQAEIVHAWSQQEPWLEYCTASKIAACEAGNVAAVVKNNQNRYSVRVIHENGYESVYSGLKDCGVENGSSIQAGQQIGISDGLAAFELRKDGLSILPVFFESDFYSGDSLF